LSYAAGRQKNKYKPARSSTNENDRKIEEDDEYPSFLKGQFFTLECNIGPGAGIRARWHRHFAEMPGTMQIFLQQRSCFTR
jgi:hypothetical protein